MEELTLKSFEEAAEKVKEATLPTNLVYSEYFSSQTGNLSLIHIFNIYYDKDSIVAYGYMMHPSDYDDIRVQITEYLNDLFKNA